GIRPLEGRQRGGGWPGKTRCHHVRTCGISPSDGALNRPVSSFHGPSPLGPIGIRGRYPPTHVERDGRMGEDPGGSENREGVASFPEDREGKEKVISRNFAQLF